MDRFNPRAPCGARPDATWMIVYREQFQSTRSVWNATLDSEVPRWAMAVSIHALRVERDPSRQRKGNRVLRFNPRAPCGARHRSSQAPSITDQFQSTRSVWSATISDSPTASTATVSIHAFRVERDETCDFYVRRSRVSIHALRVERDWG